MIGALGGIRGNKCVATTRHVATSQRIRKSRRISLKRFINRERISFELSFTAAYAGRIVESHRPGNKRVWERTPVANNHTNVRNGRVRRTVERGRAQTRFKCRLLHSRLTRPLVQ